MSFRHTVLQEGMNIFKRNGIRELTLEAILEDLNISRGTLAEIARSKTEFLEQCLEETLTERNVQFAALMERADQAPQTVLKLLKLHLETLCGSHPSFFTDLKEYHEPCWNQVEAFSQTILKGYLVKLFEAGITQEQFRPELNAPLVTELLLCQTQAIAASGVLHSKNYTFDMVINASFVPLLRGLCTLSCLPERENQPDAMQLSLN